MTKMYKFVRGYIVEELTKQKIYKITEKSLRTELLNKLNSGSGFDGQTPPFMCNPPIEKKANVED